MKPFSFLCFVIAISLSFPNFVFANKHKSQVSQNNLQVKNSQQAAQLVKARLGGKVLKVKKSNRNGQISYRVKLVKNNGHVLSVSVNAITGQLSGN